MTTVGEMKDDMRDRVRPAAEQVGIEVNSITMWPICAMDPFLEACQLIVRLRTALVAITVVSEEPGIRRVADEALAIFVANGEAKS
jgi:hypothetical protein